MANPLHPLVQKTKIELKRLDKIKERRSWEEQREYNGSFLPISVEPKLRGRALRFMSDMIFLLEKNGHGITFEYNRCHIEMYGQLTEINLRQKYFRKRDKDAMGYGSERYEKSELLEFQIGSYARKGWIDKKTKRLEDYLMTIYEYLDKDSRQWAEHREKQRIQEERDRIQKEKEAEIAMKKAIEDEKFNQLIQDAENHQKAVIIRSYLKTLGNKRNFFEEFKGQKLQEYLDWASQKADEIDPLV